MNDKFIIKIEQGPLEQSYKVAAAELTDGVNSIFELLDEIFLATVNNRFATMRTDFKQTFLRYN